VRRQRLVRIAGQLGLLGRESLGLEQRLDVDVGPWLRALRALGHVTTMPRTGASSNSISLDLTYSPE
jgi:hypothetical protein